ncbi:MAG: hypothetical protein ABIT38_23325, partial [Gemmatimonadaceae bacterium]
MTMRLISSADSAHASIAGVTSLTRAYSLDSVTAFPTGDSQAKTGRSLFNGKDLTGWHVDVPAIDSNARLRNPFA